MNLYDIEVLKVDGSVESLANYKGKVMLIVNTATKCGFTPQYEDLRKLHEKYNAKGLEILDFPCNQFGEQAPGSDQEINEFCVLKYQLPYNQFSKIEVNGENETELFKYLKEKKGFEGFNNEKNPLNSRLKEMFEKRMPGYENTPDIKWNFTKFLIDKDGNVVKRFEPVDEMDQIENEIIKLL